MLVQCPCTVRVQTVRSSVYHTWFYFCWVGRHARAQPCEYEYRKNFTQEWIWVQSKWCCICWVRIRVQVHDYEYGNMCLWMNMSTKYMMLSLRSRNTSTNPWLWVWKKCTREWTLVQSTWCCFCWVQIKLQICEHEYRSTYLNINMSTKVQNFPFAE